MNLLQALAQAMRIPELRRKLVITIGLVLAFRVLANISIPGADPKALAAGLVRIPGVVEHGLFIGLVAAAIIAGAEGVRIVEVDGS